MATIDTSTLYLLVEGTETVTYFSRSTPSAFNGASVSYAKRIVVTQDEADGVGIKKQRLAWHVWSVPLAGITPKVNDVLQDAAGFRWSVERITPNRYRTRFRLETVKEP